jgi:hypothetical protein
VEVRVIVTILGVAAFLMVMDFVLPMFSLGAHEAYHEWLPALTRPFRFVWKLVGRSRS